MKAENIAETIGYYLSKKGEVSTKGVELIKKYAKEKCKEQRELCDETMSFMEHGDSQYKTYGLEQNAPEPEFD